MIDAKTKVCCIIGDPVEHSLSPAMHNAAFNAAGLNFIYIAFRVANLRAAIEGVKSLGIAGISVTVPHKVEIVNYIDEIDEIAQKIGAVNTIINKKGKLLGMNTDWIGALKALSDTVDVKGKKVGLIGAGGAARAISYGLTQKRAQVYVFNRTISHANQLLSDFHLRENSSLTDLKLLRSMDVIINTTSVGMQNEYELPIPPEAITSQQVVFDIVYIPKETKLLKQAKKVGARVIYGYKMLLHQAVEQFKLFTGIDPDIDIMEKELLLHT